MSKAAVKTSKPRKASAKASYEAARNSEKRSIIAVRMQSATRDAPKYTRMSLVGKSRHLYNNSIVYCGIIEKLVSYVVGNGHNIIPKTSDPEFNALAKKAWDKWCERPDFASGLNFRSLQDVLCREIFVAGDAFTLKTFKNGEPKIQTIDTHRITTTASSNLDDPDGMELNSFGEVTYYKYANDENLTSFRDIAARNIVQHIFPKRLNQYRGIPVAHAALLSIHDIDDILAFEKDAVKTASSRTLIIKTASGETQEVSAFDDAEGEGESSILDKNKLTYYESKTRASDLLLAHGDDATAINDSRPSAAWQGFMQFLIESICLSTGLMPSVVLGVKVGGADTRRDLASAERIISKWQTMFCWKLQEIYEYVIGYYRARGILPQGPENWDETEWQHPPKATVDAGRDAQSDRENVKAGLLSREQYFAKQGLDWMQELRQKAIEAKFIKDLAEEHGISPELIDANFETEGADEIALPEDETKEPPLAVQLGVGGTQVFIGIMSDPNLRDIQKKNLLKTLFGMDEDASSKLFAGAAIEPAKAKARCKPGACTHDWGKKGGGK